MNADTEITLDQYYRAVVADIRAAFPVFRIVEFDRDDISRAPLEKTDLPACLLEITEFEDDAENDMGTGQWFCAARVEARIVVSFREEKENFTVRDMAVALATWIRKRRFSHPDILPDPDKPDEKRLALPTGAAQVEGAYEDSFSPQLDQYAVWRVEWTQQMTFGASSWKWMGEGEMPANIYSGFKPGIGEGNQDQYMQIAP